MTADRIIIISSMKVNYTEMSSDNREITSVECQIWWQFFRSHLWEVGIKWVRVAI